MFLVEPRCQNVYTQTWLQTTMPAGCLFSSLTLSTHIVLYQSPVHKELPEQVLLLANNRSDCWTRLTRGCQQESRKWKEAGKKEGGIWEIRRLSENFFWRKEVRKIQEFCRDRWRNSPVGRPATRPARTPQVMGGEWAVEWTNNVRERPGERRCTGPSGCRGVRSAHNPTEERQPVPSPRFHYQQPPAPMGRYLGFFGKANHEHRTASSAEADHRETR